MVRYIPYWSVMTFPFILAPFSTHRHTVVWIKLPWFHPLKPQATQCWCRQLLSTWLENPTKRIAAFCTRPLKFSVCETQSQQAVLDIDTFYSVSEAWLTKSTYISAINVYNPKTIAFVANEIPPVTQKEMRITEWTRTCHKLVSFRKSALFLFFYVMQILT